MSTPTRILFVNSSSEIGGADVDLLEICRHLDRARFEPIVVLPHGGPLSEKFSRTDIRIIYLDPAPIKRFRTPVQLIAYPFRFIAAFFRLLVLILHTRPGIVHINTSVLPAAGLAARAAGVPCIWHVREIELLQRSQVVGALLRLCMRLCADRIVAISRAVASAVGPAAQPKVRVIYHGVDTERFRPRDIDHALRGEVGLPARACVIGYVGRLAPIKGLEYLIGAFHQIAQSSQEAYLLLVGPDPGYPEYVQRLHALTAGLGLTERVIFLPAGREIADVMHTIDLLVLPTIIPEGLGLVILEALASGKAVVATNQGGPLEILSGCSAGRLVPPRDAEALAAAIRDLLQGSPERREQQGAAARQWALERFSLERMLDELSQVYESVTQLAR